MSDHFVDPETPAKHRHSRVGVTGFVVLAALFAAWAGLGIWEKLEGTDPKRLIRSGNVTQRRRAALDLRSIEGRNGLDELLTPLIHALDDTDAEVRSTSAQSLAVILQNVLIHPSNRPDLEANTRRWKDTTTRALLKVLSDQDPLPRAAAAAGLGVMIGTSRPASPQQLESALEDGTFRLNRALVETLEILPDAVAPPELVAALKDSSSEVRASAARAFSNFPLGVDAAIPDLLSMLANDEPLVQSACRAATWVAWPSAAAVPVLIERHKTGRPEARARAAILLGRIGRDADSAVPALLATLNEPPDPAVPQSARSAMQQDAPCAAARALGEISSSDEVVEALIGVLRSDHDYRHDDAAYALARIGPSARGAVPALIAAYSRWLDGAALNGGWWMTTALGRIAPGSAAETDAINVLIRALKGRPGPVRTAVAYSLGRFGPKAAAATPELFELKEKDRSPDVRAALAAALAQIDPAGNARHAASDVK